MTTPSATKKYILNNWFGSVTYSVDTQVWFGLTTSTIDSTGSLTGEVTGGAYARVSYANDTTTSGGGWITSSNTSSSNNGAITFPESTASWGEIKSVFIAADSSGGNAIFYCNISPTIVVGSNTVIEFAAGTVIVTI